MKKTFIGLKVINENVDTGFIQLENEDKLSWWMPEEFYKAWKELDNMRRSRDYFRLERDNLKRLHEELLSIAHNRIDKVERSHQTIEANVSNLLNENSFLRDELDLAERDITLYKSALIAVGFVTLSLFGMICYNAL